jgi:microcystin-dependent protein
MHRINTSGSSGGLFQDSTNPKTVVDASWLNDVQENIMAVLTAGSISPVAGTYTQLRDAIIAMLPNATTSVRGVAVLATGVETAALTNSAKVVTPLGLASLAAILTPAGALQAFAMSAAPTGWLKANGAAVSRTTYAALFAAIGTSFGVGDGSTTFNVPDLRGEFLRGLDDSRGVDTGRALGTAQAGMIEAHTHDVAMRPEDYDNGGTSLLTTNAAVDAGNGGSVTIDTVAVQSAGGVETRPRNQAALFCIKY